MDNNKFNIKFPHCTFYYFHLYFLLPAGIFLNLVYGLTGNVLSIIYLVLQIIQYCMFLKHYKYSFNIFVLTQLCYSIFFVFINLKNDYFIFSIITLLSFDTLEFVYMYKRKYILTHKRVEMQYAPTKKDNKNIKKLNLFNMVNPYNNKFMLKDKDVAEYILIYNNENDTQQKDKTIIKNNDNNKIFQEENLDGYSKEEIIDYLKDYLDLQEEICYNIYYASDLFKKEKRVEAIKIIEDKLLPQLKEIKDLDKIEKIFDLLEGNLGLNEKDTHYYITKLFNNN